MNIAFHWLKDWVNINESAATVANELSVKGLEVEHLETWKKYNADFDNMVVAQVTKKWKHPDADKLSVTEINTGHETLQIVCGAPNVAEGQKVILAKVGCTISLPSGESFVIKKSKIRGQESNGMLCAEDEIGLGKGHDGILVLPPNTPIGTAVSELYQNKIDEILEIGLTANRGDAASHLGTARDVAAIFKAPLTQLPNPFVADGQAKINIDIQDKEACSQYTAVLLNIKNESSPLWIQERLQSIGIEPKNAVVDITNYILHDMGQPMHAFDASKLGNHISVRRAKSGEKLITLDKKELDLLPKNLVIANEQGPVALAGVMGGQSTAISLQSTQMVLECAHFNAAVVRKTAKSHYLNSDSSYRFERGVDPQLGPYAISKALDLLTKYASAQIIGSVQATGNKIETRTIHTSSEFISQMAGSPIASQEQKTILESLGFTIKETGNNWEVAVPSWRTDCVYEVDLVEEVLRVYGFDNIPMPQQMKLSMPVFKGAQLRVKENKIREYQAAQGFMEISTNSLVSIEDFEDKNELVHITNPLSSDMGVMRLSLLPSMLKTMSYNQNRSNSFTHFFEIGKSYRLDGENTQENKELIIAAMGNQTRLGWEKKDIETNFYFIKSHVQRILQSQKLKWDDKHIQISETTAEQNKKFGLDKNVHYAILKLDELFKQKTKDLKVKSIPKFPRVSRDLSLVVNKNIAYSTWKKIISQANPLLLAHTVFDIYEGKPLADTEKSIAITFEFGHDSRTLQGTEIDAIMNKLMDDFEKAGAVIRK